MHRVSPNTMNIEVALYTSAWIEIPATSLLFGIMFGSHSIRVRGLKYLLLFQSLLKFPVALYTSAWIEI